MRRVQILIWIFVGPLFLMISFFGVMTVVAASSFSRRLSPYMQTVWFAEVEGALVILGITLCVIGRSAKQLLQKALRLPGEKCAVLAATFSIGIPVLITAGQYLFERAQWIRHSVSPFAPSEGGGYFTFPELWLLYLFFPAVCEEIIFRGWLQPRFIQRFGLYRGIFLVGIVWGAFHFPSDFSSSRFDAWGRSKN